ncbi:Uncharacterised protein [uncultured archaeon]|nr:Uncharacterised protein [uncultured archaeon]
MNKIDLYQTILISFIVAFVVEVISWIRSSYIAYINFVYKDELLAIGSWFPFLFLFGSILILIITYFPQLLGIENFDQKFIKDLRKLGFWIGIGSIIIIIVDHILITYHISHLIK